MLSLIITAGKLKGIKRKGWVRIGIKDAESVACHVYRVAFISMILGDMLSLDCEKLIKMALLHDLAEAIVGDITPYEMKEKEKKEIERKAMEKLLKGWREYYNLWEEYVKNESKESKLLHQIDKFEMILQAYEYMKKYRLEELKEFLKEKEKIKEEVLLKLLEKLI